MDNDKLETVFGKFKDKQMILKHRTLAKEESEWRCSSVKVEGDVQRRRFSVKNKCDSQLFALIVPTTAVVCCVTFLFPGTRTPVKHPYTSELTWWQKSIVYQIYPMSFQDTDGDGTGDIKGITFRLPYLQELGIGAVWLSPFFKSPMKDLGYDVSDYRQVDPIFGTLQDFDQMIMEAHRLGLRIIVDFIPNHSSDQHHWFQMSKNKTGKYSNYYVWSPGKLLPNGTRVEPNNWNSKIQCSGSAWEWNNERGEYYYHAYLKEQPDLNYRNEDVLDEMDNVLRFWLGRGVDGFRIDTVPQLFEVENLSLEIQPGDKDQIGIRFTAHQPEIFDVVRRWKSVLNEYELHDGNDRWLLAEANRISDSDRHKYYAAGSTPFFFDLVKIMEVCETVDAPCIRNVIKKGVNLNDGEWPNFVTGNHDHERVSDRFGPEFVEAMNMLLLTLPGTPTTYYGEEIGMKNGNYKGKCQKDTFALFPGNLHYCRDPERNPMQWNTSLNAGFSSGPPDKLWLPITSNVNYQTLNVEVQSKEANSTLSMYRRLAFLRQEPAFLNANIQFLTDTFNGSNIVAYTRSDGAQSFSVIINFGDETTVFVDQRHRNSLVKATTSRFFDLLETTINIDNIVMKKGDGLVLRLE